MTAIDIARLGFAVATAALKEGKAALDALVPSARRAEQATDSLNQSTQRADSAVRQAAAGTSGFGTRLAWFAGMIRNGNNGVLSFAQGLNTVPGAAARATSSLDRLGKSASDNINRMQATPGNIAAQFQDIGVTAAGGMSPMLIALQQGTQLSAALAGGLGNLGAAFKQLFGVTTLLTIGLVAVAAALIQSVDWTKAAASAMEWLASVMVEAAPYAVALAAGLLLINAPAILTGVVALTKAMYGLAAGLLAVIGIPALIVIGLVAIVAAAVHFRDELTQYLGFDIVKVVQDSVNWIIGTFVGGYNGIKAAWSKLPAAIGDLTIQAANATLAAIDGMVNGTITRINGLTKQLPFGIGENIQMGSVKFGRQDNPYAGAAAEVGQMVTASVQAARQVDYVGKGIKLARDYAKQGADYLRSWAKDLRAGDPEKGKKDKAGPKGGKTEAEKWADLLTGADKTMRSLEQAGAQIGLYGQQLAQLKYEQDLFNKAEDAGIKLTAEMTAELKKRAAEMGAKDESNRHRAFMENMIEEADMLQAQLARERGAIGLTGEAAIQYAFVTERLLAAKRAHIELSPMEVAAINAAGAAYAQQRAEIDATTAAAKRQEEQLKFLKDTVKGVFTEWVNSVRQGQNAFSALADAVLNALNKIIDRALNSALDAALDAILPSGTKLFAKGGVFSNDNEVTAFAKGGVVSSPTTFKFAKGTGLMGEAGPEAIMPLKRGADGALGVQMHGKGGGAPSAPVVTVTNHYAISGAVSSAEIVQSIQQSAEQTKNDVLRALPGALAEYQRDGTTG